MPYMHRYTSFATAREAKSFAGIVRNFTPNWFTVTMGTGALALTIEQLPWQLPWQLPSAVPYLHRLAVALWLANIVLFATFSALYAARWVIHFDGARRIADHPVMSMFFGAIPMGLATIVNGFLTFGPKLIGPAAIAIAHALWWTDAAASVLCGIAIPYLMFTRQQHSIEKLTAVWLLPIVAAEVAAASGALLAPHLAPAEGFTVLLLSYALWAFSVPLAMSILVLLVLRLALHKLPDRDLGASAWLALGPIGTGALGLVLLGGDAPAIFTGWDAALAPVGEVAFGVGVIGGTVLWGYGVWWLALAVLKTIRYLREGLPFNLGWWGFTFPLAVYTLATLALARVTHLALFSVAGGGLALCLGVLWIIVAARTLHGVCFGDLFVAPCLTMRHTVPRRQADAV